MRPLPPIPPNCERFQKRTDGFTEFLVTCPIYGDFGIRQGEKPFTVTYHLLLDNPQWPTLPETIQDVSAVAEVAWRKEWARRFKIIASGDFDAIAKMESMDDAQTAYLAWRAWGEPEPESEKEK